MLLGMGEILVISVVALVVLGPEKMPEALRKLARALSQMRRVADDIKQNFDEMWVEPQPQLRARPAPTSRVEAEREQARVPIGADSQADEHDPLDQHGAKPPEAGAQEPR